jgi:hypothetical protein
MESIITLLERIPPTFWGIIVGALFTIIGVVLTNAANIKRLRLQQAYERERAEKQWDTNLRRDTYLSAIEAISAGMVVVGRFADFNVPHQELMRSYTDKSPSIAKVTLVGKEKTIEAVANFSQLLTGAFLRLSASREQLNGMMAQLAALEDQIETAREEEARLLALIHEHELSGHVNEALENRLQQKLAGVREKIESLQAEQTAVDDAWPIKSARMVSSKVKAGLCCPVCACTAVTRQRTNARFTSGCGQSVYNSSNWSATNSSRFHVGCRCKISLTTFQQLGFAYASRFAASLPLLLAAHCPATQAAR